MKANLHTVDRILRLLIGAATAILFFTEQISGTFGIVLLVIGFVLGSTALINFCPIYSLLGISTRKPRKE